MVDWNKLMRESLITIMPNQESQKTYNKIKTDKIIKTLEENKITNVGKNTPYTKNDKKDSVQHGNNKFIWML